MQSFSFVINGATLQALHAEPCSLIEYLRDDLGLKGTRLGCAQEKCGACVVLVDGQPRHSCQIEIGNLVGRSIQTVESLERSVEGQILLAQFEAHQAGQCGFCLSGILVRALAFVRQPEDGSRAALMFALEEHLCRCGAHPRIVAAIEASWQAVNGRKDGA